MTGVIVVVGLAVLMDGLGSAAQDKWGGDRMCGGRPCLLGRGCGGNESKREDCVNVHDQLETSIMEQSLAKCSLIIDGRGCRKLACRMVMLWSRQVRKH
jgi:hypothetical protein